MPAGRPPKPTHLKVLEGNPGKRELNKNEPKPTQKAPKCPKWLDPVAKKEWKRVVPELERLKLLTVIDGATLEMMCTTYSRWVYAEEAIRQYMSANNGLLTFITPNGYPQQIPEIGIANQMMKTYLRFCAEFGLSPSSRSRLRLPTNVKKNPFGEFLSRGKKPSGS